MAFPDVLAMLCTDMTTDFGTRTVTDLPANLELPLIQVITIDDVPGNKPMNGRALTTTVSVDVLYFGSKTGPDALAQLRAFANAGSDWIVQWAPQGIITDETSRPVRRPDYNPNVLRFGAVVDFLCTHIPT